MDAEQTSQLCGQLVLHRLLGGGGGGGGGVREVKVAMEERKEGANIHTAERGVPNTSPGGSVATTQWPSPSPHQVGISVTRV